MSRARRQVHLGFTDEPFEEGRHIAYVYSDDAERMRTMARFLQQGLRDGEKVLYLADDLSPEAMREELARLGVGAGAGSDSRDLDVTAGHHTLCPGHRFSVSAMLEQVGRYYDEAIEAGYAGVRGAGEMSWALVEGRATMPDLIDYESRLNEMLEAHLMTAVCQYDARRFDGELIMDMLRVHPLMIVHGQLVKNPAHVPFDPHPQVKAPELHER